MRRLVLLIGCAIVLATSSAVQAAGGDPIYVDQGPRWTASARADFYTRDQGSRLISLAWMQALRKDGQPFLSDSMSRYGFLPNPESAAGLPVGFHASGPRGFQTVGVTCSACHTRQLEVDGKMYRVDGGPSLTDFQAFLSDLDKAVAEATASEASFAAFAAAVLNSPTPAAADVTALRNKVDAWHRRYHAWMVGTLPTPGWGLGRLDAVGIIFNRLSGLDVGPPPDLLIPENMKPGDAPVRYPFLWNSPVQDLTDWGGFVMNGNDVFALSRNTGQALAFADFEPARVGPLFNYLNNNSINFDGLNRLEELIRQIGPPKWQWPINQALRADGERIFQRECAQCHGIKEGAFRSLFDKTWATPVQNVGTDTRQFDELGRKVKTGVLAGASIPGIARKLQEEDFGVHMMFTAVAGSIGQHILIGEHGSDLGGLPSEPMAPLSGSGASGAPASQPQVLPGLQDLAKAMKTPDNQPAAAQPDSLTIESGTLLVRTLHRGAYEARVLQGIWAAAPYLHNGSVPTLAELLKPSAQRTSKFSLGAKYDIENIGLAATQDGPDARPVTDCNDLNSGNSKCGHEFGTNLSDGDKKALLEYLKTL
ncbi:di-heme-cytochrome C peroxidase [Bradyrhizobium sp.]|uniref:di-heme-cytochrome C peroxidase n=1 Tax=Bradyrhizobium sp. TaxID=376 RepID=UPI0025B940BE|nr:di-heme-cytochrome C peroxidase [Bradyrhizobium sp.]MBV8920491.1 c-type cytochrome [Bradyrhizobium sp.]